VARKGPSTKREIQPDPVYNSVLVNQIVNRILVRGEKGKAEKIVYGALEIIEQKTSGDPMAVMRKAVENVRPILEVRSRRVGGASYQIPVEVPARRSNTLAIRWIVNYSRQRPDKLLDAANYTGPSIKKKEDLHKMADANKAFAHYRW
jgi:small subunit ribosomal protein S7